MALVCAMTVTGNLSVLLSLRRARRAATHYPLASLAAADLLVGTCVVPLAAAREVFVFQLNRAVCACWSTLDVLCCTASIISLCALGWERWWGITAPLATDTRMRRAKLLAVLVWPISTAVALPTAFIPSPVNYHESEQPKACTVNTNIGYVFFSITCSFYIPVSVMIFFYAKIFQALSTLPTIRAHRGRTPCTDANKPNKVASPRNVPVDSAPVQNNDVEEGRRQSMNRVCLTPKGKQLNQPPRLPAPARPPSPVKSRCGSPGGNSDRQRRASRTIIMLMTLFLICWTPFFIMLPVDSICGECVWDMAWQWCTWLGYANSALNPVVYASAAPRVQRAIRMSLTWSTWSSNSK